MSFHVGQRIQSIVDHNLRGVITIAPAPGMRTVEWDDGSRGEVDTRDIELEGGAA